MRRFAPATIALLAFITLVGLALSLPPNASAIVNDVTFTGGGIGPQTIKITNEDTQDSAEGDRRITGGAIFIPLENRNWSSRSKYTITFTDPQSGKPVTVKGVELKDGRNQVNLDTLLATAGGAGAAGTGASNWQTPGHVLDFHVGWRFFSIKEIGPSVALRVDYSPPFIFNQESFNLRPYGSFWVAPSVSINGHKPFDNGSVQRKIDNGSMYGLNFGLKHVSDMKKWGLQADDVTILGILMAGLGWVRYDFNMHEVDPGPHFTDERQFNSKSDAFRMEFNTGIAVSKNNYFVGLKGGVAPTVTDIFNGGTKLRWEGNLSVVGGWKF